jgi:hypothetical protein
VARTPAPVPRGFGYAGTMLILALAGGSLVFLAFVIVFGLAIAFGYYTRRGSGINQRPSDGRGEAPGADGASSITTTRGDGDERTVGTHGTG